MIARGSRRRPGFLFEGSVALAVLLIACLGYGQGLGDVAEREKAKRDAAAREKARREAAAREKAEPADAMPTEAPPAEAPPDEPLPAEAKPAEAPPDEPLPAEAKPAEAPPDDREAGPATPSPGADTLPALEPAEPLVSRDERAGADPASATTPSLSFEDLPPDLPWCEPGLEMLRAWSESHLEYAAECGRADLPSFGRFDIEIVVSGDGRLEAAIVDPENGYTTCLAERLRGRPMPRPVDGKRCRAKYGSQWRR
jgi:hypothetical protein